MSLIDKRMTECVRLIKTQAKDGYGGNTTTYKQGESFSAAIVLSANKQPEIAQKETLVNNYKITTKKQDILHFNEVIQRKEDGKTFRILTDGADFYTPEGAGLNLRQVDAEAITVKAVIPNDSE